MPTVEEIEKVWDLPDAPATEEEGEEKTKYVRAISVLTWYLDRFMPMAVGLEFWGPNIRPFHLLTDFLDIEGDVSGKKKVLVSVTSEAFGILMYANCRDKWVADFELRASNKKAKIPKYNKDDPSTFKHQNKWSNSRTGQIQGGGWNRVALKYFNAQIAAIQAFREEEKKGEAPERLQFGQNLILAANSINLEDDNSASKKRKRGGKPEDEIEVVDICFLDE